MKLLVIFSNPSDQPHLRLDKEDKALMGVARRFGESVVLERQHASEIEDIHPLIMEGEFDVIQFSGHGHADGICLEKSHCEAGATELVNAERVVDIICLARRPPLLAVFLSCYADNSLSTLAGAAPFVITSRFQVSDTECIAFVRGFYEVFFKEPSVQNAFNHAIHVLGVKELPKDRFRLSRRSLIRKGNSLYVESTPDLHRDTILVNLDQVKHQLGQFGLSEEELCHLLAKKLRVHYWIFERARETATIPIGRLLFGEFEWQNAKDVVFCTRLMKLRSDVPQPHWELWAKALTSYNDLASCEYRTAPDPVDPRSRGMLKRAVQLFSYHTDSCLKPMRRKLEEVGRSEIMPHIEFAIAQTEKAVTELERKEYPRVVEALELALTNYHEVVTALQPPEEEV